MKKAFICLLVAASVSGCANELQQVNQSLMAVNQALATPAQSRTSQYAPAGARLPAMTAAQLQTLQAHKLSANTDAALTAARHEAWPVIEKVIGVVSCYPEWNPSRYIGQYLAPGMNSMEVAAPMHTMNYHPKTQCVSVARMDNWSMPARNAIAFRAVYLSDSSGESKSFNYELVKQPDGAWLYRRVGF